VVSDIRAYRNMLRINKHRLDDELEVQSQVLDDISSKLTVLNSRTLEANDQLKLVEARLFRELKDDNEKMTDKNADALVKQDPDRKRAWQAAQAARAEHEDWSGLYDAWKARGFALRELCGLYVAQYFTIDSFTGGRDDRPHRKGGEERARMERPAYTSRVGLLGGRDENRDEEPAPDRVAGRVRRKVIE
jgi:hypothetical protein